MAAINTSSFFVLVFGNFEVFQKFLCCNLSNAYRAHPKNLPCSVGFFFSFFCDFEGLAQYLLFRWFEFYENFDYYSLPLNSGLIIYDHRAFSASYLDGLESYCGYQEEVETFYGSLFNKQVISQFPILVRSLF